MDSRQELDAVLTELIRAYDQVTARIEEAFTADPDTALEKIRDVYDTLGKLRERAAALRADMVGRIWEHEELSLTALADRIGVSRQRADQLLKQRDQVKGDGGTG